MESWSFRFHIPDLAHRGFYCLRLFLVRQEEAEHLISSAEAQHFPERVERATRAACSKASKATARLQRAAQQAEAALARVEQGSKRKR